MGGGSEPSAKPGAPWGARAVVPPEAITVGDDAAARAVVEQARRQHREPPPLVLAGGDLSRTLGGPSRTVPRPGEEATRAVVDVGEALVDGRLRQFVAHLVVRQPTWRGGWWRGSAVAVMNAEWLGSWDVVPRGHPGDGRLELVEAALAPWDRWKVRRRLPSGGHLPHPGIRIRPVTAHQLVVRGRMSLWLDGERAGSAHELSVRVRPGVLEVYV